MSDIHDPRRVPVDPAPAPATAHVTPAQVTEEHRDLFCTLTSRHHSISEGAELIAASEARATEAIKLAALGAIEAASKYTATGYHEETDLVRQDFADKGTIAVFEMLRAKANERDQLRADVRELQEQIGQQLAACDCAAIMDTPETHEKNKTVTRDNPFWSPAFESVMRRTAECIALRAEVERLKERLKLVNAINDTFATDDGWKARAETAEAELAHLRKVNKGSETNVAFLRAELAKERVRLDWLANNGGGFVHDEAGRGIATTAWGDWAKRTITPSEFRSAIDAAMKERAK